MSLSGEFIPWLPLPDYVAHPLLTAEVEYHYPSALIRLCRKEDERVPAGPDLVIRFDAVAALLMHEEFVHPGEKDSIYPRIDRYGRPYPCLVAVNSPWLASFSEGQLASFANCTHYRFVTDFPTVDVLCAGNVSARWDAPRGKHERLGSHDVV